MKTSKLIKRIDGTASFVEFHTKSQKAHVEIKQSSYAGSVQVYVGDGDAQADYQHLDASDLRELAKKFNRIADHLDGLPISSDDL
jgi:hypothetical protein